VGCEEESRRGFLYMVSAGRRVISSPTSAAGDLVAARAALPMPEHQLQLMIKMHGQFVRAFDLIAKTTTLQAGTTLARCHDGGGCHDLDLEHLECAFSLAL
jgi:hypothetical protein